MNPEIFSWIFPKILELGALDVFVTPIIMKKNRPANKLSVLCKEKDTEKLENFIFQETTTLGIRKMRVERNELRREFRKIMTLYGEVSFKLAFQNESLVKYSPEYEDCKAIAEKFKIPLIKVYNEIMQSIKIDSDNKK